MSTDAAEAGAIEAVERAYGSLVRGGPAELLARYDELFTPDLEWHPALVATIEGDRAYVGREDFAEYWRQFTEVFPDPFFGEPSSEEVSPGRVLVTAAVRFFGAASRVPVEQDVGFVFDVRDGRVAAGRSFFSPDEAREFARDA